MIIFEIRKTANYDLDGIDYEFISFESPQEMKEKVVKRNEESNKSRILAGYCWNWPKAGRSDTNAHEIKIGDFEISWNLDEGGSIRHKPHFNQRSRLHSYDARPGIRIRGGYYRRRLALRNGHLVTDYTKRAKTDQSIKGLKKMEKEDPECAHGLADEIIKNTYRTLMPRGMKGCYVYATDPGLREYLKVRCEKSYHYHVVSV